MNNNIKMIKVDSSNVDEVGYDEAEQVLYVRFLTGALYIYKGVSVYEFRLDPIFTETSEIIILMKG